MPRVAVDLFACWQSKYGHFESSKFLVYFPFDTNADLGPA